MRPVAALLLCLLDCGPSAREPAALPSASGPAPEAAPPEAAPSVAVGPDSGAAVSPADPLAGFRAALEAVRRREPGRLVRIAHLGDSHTAADVLTGRLRETLQAELGDGGHGFVVPGWADARLHRGVTLRDGGGWVVERVRYAPFVDVGDRLFGIGAASVRSAAAGTWASVAATGASFDVFYLEQPAGGTLELRLDGAAPVRIPTRADRARPAFHRVEAPDGPHVLELRVVGDGEVRVFGVSIERTGPGVVYSSLGVMGARVSTPGEWHAPLFDAQLARLEPDLVVAMYGTNDLFAEDYQLERFGSALQSLLARVHAATPTASCLVLAPPDVARRVGGGPSVSVPALPALVERARHEAEAAGCAFWDTLAEMGGPGSILSWAGQRPALAGRDHVHLTRPGYEKLADALAGWLRGTSVATGTVP